MEKNKESIRNGLLILDVDIVDYSLGEWKKNGVSVGLTLKKQNILLRAIRRCWVKFHLPFQSIWYGDWKKHLSEYNTILIHSSWLAEGIPHWIRKKAGKSKDELRIIWWYWNRVMPKDHPDRIAEEDCEKWSFDQADCKKYHMNFNTQYYFRSHKIPADLPVSSDIYYLGSDGGRLPMLMGLYRQFENMGFSMDFNIFTTGETMYHKQYPQCFIKDKMSYQDNLKHIGSCKAVLDIMREGQSGQTLRPLECLFHQRKLITNNRNIDSMVYYHPDNIFILEKNEIEDLPAFLEKPFHPISEEIMEIYESKAWLERF